MDHQDHVQLIQDGVKGATNGIWADLGSGRGAFTLALAELLDHKGVIYSVDQDRHALRQQSKEMQKRFPASKINYMPEDFTQPLDLPALDGILMANSLHFILDKPPILQRLITYLKPGGRLILVEYNTDQGNHWVPYPLTFDMWVKLARDAGFASTERLMTRSSSFLGEFYSAISRTPEPDEMEEKA